MGCVNEDMTRKGVTSGMTSDRLECKDETYSADPK